MKKLVFLLVLFLGLAKFPPVYADSLKVEVRLGIKGVYKENMWSPVTVSISKGESMPLSGKVIVSLET
ncbi:MAG: hypothetical protein AAB296_09270 [Candidatus Desantisbacteria bacterium]